MEEMMTVMMMKNMENHETYSSNQPNVHHIIIPSTTTTCPTWKLYENPFYISPNYQKQQEEQDNHLVKNLQQESYPDQKQIHRLHLPVPARKITTSFWDLTFIKSLMDSELETARAQINQLKVEIESERKARKKMEALNKRLARELSEERKGREAVEGVCQQLAKEISSDRAEINRMREEIQEERKMLRVAQVIREERVQMKLAEAKILMEEKFEELEKKIGMEPSSSLSSNVPKKEAKTDHKGLISSPQTFSLGKKLKFILGEKTVAKAGSCAENLNSMAVVQKRVVPETENPHIQRGIKGFVEFPKVAKAIGCKSSKHLNTKLECQKAQLKILLKHKGPVQFSGLVAR